MKSIIDFIIQNLTKKLGGKYNGRARWSSRWRIWTIFFSRKQPLLKQPFQGLYH
jgi:hypothetical protein